MFFKQEILKIPIILREILRFQYFYENHNKMFVVKKTHENRYSNDSITWDTQLLGTLGNFQNC